MSDPVAGDETRGKVLEERELEDGWVEREYDGGKVETRTPGLAIALVEAAVRRADLNKAQLTTPRKLPVRAWRDQS